MKLLFLFSGYFYILKSEGVYLETEEGRQYQELFRSIRLRHIINDSASIAVLENDKIIPQGNNKTFSCTMNKKINTIKLLVLI